MKTATIKVHTYEWYDEEEYVIKHEMPLDIEEMDGLSKWTKGALWYNWDGENFTTNDKRCSLTSEDFK